MASRPEILEQAHLRQNLGETATCGHKARQEETIMMAFDAMEPEHMAFLYELYARSAGDARQGVPMRR